MTPTIQEGDLVAITEVELSDVEVGDVLAVRFGELRVVHRLVEIIDAEPDLFRLKGDGNERPDPILYEESQIIGKVVAVYPLRYLLAYGPVILLTAGVLLSISLGGSPKVNLNEVLLCLIISLSMGGIIGYRLIGG